GPGRRAVPRQTEEDGHPPQRRRPQDRRRERRAPVESRLPRAGGRSVLLRRVEALLARLAVRAAPGVHRRTPAGRAGGADRGGGEVGGETAQNRFSRWGLAPAAPVAGAACGRPPPSP